MRTFERQQGQISFLQGYEGAKGLRRHCRPKTRKTQQIAAGYADKTNKSRTETKGKKAIKPNYKMKKNSSGRTRFAT